MSERLVNPSLAIAGITLIRGCHLAVSPAIPAPPGAAATVALDPSLTSISQFSLAVDPPLEADVPVTLRYTLAGHTNGHVLAVVMGAATTPRDTDGTYEEVITPLAETDAIQFRTSANTDGILSGFSVDDGA